MTYGAIALRQRLVDAGAKIGRYPSQAANGSASAAYTHIAFEQLTVRKAQLSDVAEIADVEIIQFKDCKVEGGALGALRSLQRPAGMVFDKCELSPDAFSEIDALDVIVNLTVIDSPIDNTMLLQLHDLPKLRVFYLRGGDVSGVGLAFLARSPLLRDLTLVDLAIEDDQVSQIVDAHDLNALSFSSSRITDRAMEKVATLKHLTQLQLSGCNKITDAGLVHIAELSSLTSLDLASTAITDDGLRHLAKLRSLESLGLGYTSVTEDGLRNLSGLRLKIVDNPGTHITGAALRRVFGNHVMYAVDTP